MTLFTRRHVMAASAAVIILATPTAPVLAQDAPTLRFSAVFSEQDIRADMMDQFAEAIAEDFTFDGYYGGTLFRQGTELVALQRGNLEMSNVAPQDIALQIPEWSVLTSAYLFRDADHVRDFFASEVGEEFKQMVEDQLGVIVLGPTYFGTRHVGLRGDREVNTPEDMDGVVLRMPGGDAWQFLGTSLGANPSPVAYAEVYTSLQNGQIDGQDNPLPNVENMRFYEVMDQIVLTSHLVAFDVLVVSKTVWDEMSPEVQESFQAAADAAIDFSQQAHLDREAELTAFLEEQGLVFHTPDIDAFRTYAQDMYLNSEFAASWPEGILERIGEI